MKRRYAGFALAAIVIALLLVLVFRRSAPPAPPASRPHVPVAVVRYGTVERTLDLTGRVGPAAGTQTKLAFSVPGTVAHIDVALGQRVASGRVLARLDATPLSLAAQQAQAASRAAAAQEAYARIDRVSVRQHVDQAELARQRVLLRAGVVSQASMQTAEAVVAADRADVESAREALAAARAQAVSASAAASSASYNLSQTLLHAPFDGVVVGVYAQPGQVVDTTVPIVAVSASMTSMATLDVPVTDITRVASGDLVRVQCAGQRFNARVGAVAPTVNPATGLAELTVDGIPADVPAGTPIDATVVYGHVRGPIVPQSSLIADPQTGHMLAFVESLDASRNQKFSLRNVTVNAQDSRDAVVSGVRAGERVATEGTINLLAPSAGRS